LIGPPTTSLPAHVTRRLDRSRCETVGIDKTIGDHSELDDDAALMARALEEAREAIGHGDVPVGAIVVRDGIVIAARHNERELTGDPTAHAELLAMRDAAGVAGSWRLDRCTVVVTLEPCPMCAGAMVNARVQRLVYGALDPKAGAVTSLYEITTDARLNHRLEVVGGVHADESAELLRAFFGERRRGSLRYGPP